MQAMAFSDLPFTDDSISFVHHPVVLAYLQRYAQHHNLLQHIHFNTTVTSVTPRNNKDTEGWIIRTMTQESQSERKEEWEVDAVVVCSGHFFEPYIPREIEGVERFPGQLVHSRDYRTPIPFKDHVCVVVGAGPSGVDVARELSGVVRKLYLCTRERDAGVVQGAVGDRFATAGLVACERVTGSVMRLTPEGLVEFSDGSVTSERVDSVVFCTGYYYHIPFLDPSCDVKFSLPLSEESMDEEDAEVEGECASRCVAPLYAHLIHIRHPSLIFVGLPFKVFLLTQTHALTKITHTHTQILPFPCFEVQARCVVELMKQHPQLFWGRKGEEDEETGLWTRKGLEAAWGDLMEAWKQKGLPQRYFHLLGGNQWEYFKRLEKECGITEPTFNWKVLEEVYNDVSNARIRDQQGYRNLVYHLKAESWKRIE